VIQLVEVEPPRRMVMRRADQGGADRREVDLTEDGGGTLIRMVEARRVGPVARVLSRLPGGAGEPLLLRDLARWLGTAPRVARIP
jgi:hypothetical protein